MRRSGRPGGYWPLQAPAASTCVEHASLARVKTKTLTPAPLPPCPLPAARPSAIALPRAPPLATTSARLSPLPLAVQNAQHVRHGRPALRLGAWRGCGASPWCNQGAGHGGGCNNHASLPGISAYDHPALLDSGLLADDAELAQ